MSLIIQWHGLVFAIAHSSGLGDQGVLIVVDGDVELILCPLTSMALSNGFDQALSVFGLSQMNKYINSCQGVMPTGSCCILAHLFFLLHMKCALFVSDRQINLKNAAFSWC